MSHQQAWVRFDRDGLVMFAEYDGTCDILLTPLYTDYMVCRKAWRDGAHSECSCGRDEPAEYADAYNCGHGPIRACRHCLAITDVTAFDPKDYGFASSPHDGIPEWVDEIEYDELDSLDLLFALEAMK